MKGIMTKEQESVRLPYTKKTVKVTEAVRKALADRKPYEIVSPNSKAGKQ